MTDDIDEIMETYQYQMNQARIKKEEFKNRLIKAREVEAEVNAEVAKIEKSIKPLISLAFSGQLPKERKVIPFHRIALKEKQCFIVRQFLK